jgi:hypothetical protein
VGGHICMNNIANSIFAQFLQLERELMLYVKNGRTAVYPEVWTF